MAITRIKAETALSGTIPSTNISESSMANVSTGTSWQSVITADGSTFNTAVAGEGYFIDTTSAAHTITLPASPSAGDEVTIVDYAGTFGTNNVTVGRNGSNVDGSANNPTLNTNRENVRFVYMDSTQGWRSIFDGASTTYGTAFVSATGGTVTTSGDYKIHTFTGDGCFVVSQVGSGGAPSVVDYLVVAGGGGGGGSSAPYGGGTGGGAGGFRESLAACSPTHTPSGHTASPLKATTGITVTAQTYPISVGAGGAGSSGGQQGNNGSNSSFSTITSAGGGFGGGCQGGTSTGANGGSGGGGRDAAWAGGNGNTPPVSPPQGQNGGTSPTSDNQAGGGGGAIGTGGTGNSGGGGGGAGAGLTGFGTGNGECSSCKQYFSGGGSGASAGPHIAGGSGGGGQGGSTLPSGTNPGGSGTDNTGGGGGGGPGCGPGTSGAAGAGGSGVVMIRYRFQ